MRVLFLHPNFPGQFRGPAAHLAARGHEVVCLCQTHYGRSLPGVRRATLKGAVGHDALEARRLPLLERTLALAEQYRRGMAQLKAEGFAPDRIVSHSGWGCGLHAPLVWPAAPLVAYLEWWFAADAELLRFDPANPWLHYGPADALSLRQRNLPLGLELSEAAAIVAPTAWQRWQLPPSLRRRCQVLPDGVDLQRFHPPAGKREGPPLLTYGTRGMEAMRGFPEWIQELPAVLERWPELQVEIAGEEGISYGGKGPPEGFRTWAEQRLAPWMGAGRVRFLGRLSRPRYEAWLRRSWVHVYLTMPFVASWSLLEAMASGACLIASAVAPVREFLDADSAVLVDHRQPGWLAGALEPLLHEPPRRLALGFAARERASNCSQGDALKRWERLLGQELTTGG